MAKGATILTLDAGGTNLVFSAVKERKILIEPITRPSVPYDLKRCIAEIIQGFKAVSSQLKDAPAAISFAFPGPADYEHGIIGNLPNFPAFTGDVPLGPILEHAFGIPVFIKNDGDLFAYGEATSGYLPFLNEKLEAAGSLKRFKNLVGITLGTGIGAGIVADGKMLEGDNSCSAEIHNSLNYNHPDWNCEESVSTRAIQRVYADEAGLPFDAGLLPGTIYEIARGRREGNELAALISFKTFGRSLGNVICNVVTLIDGIVVLGGGITAGWDLFGPYVFEQIRRKYEDPGGLRHPRLSLQVYDLTDEGSFEVFAKGNVKTIPVPGTGESVQFDAEPRIGVGVSRLGASQAIMLGAHDYAVARITDK